MPELPEVETVARGLRRLALGKKISDIRVLERKQFRPAVRQWRAHVLGATLTGVRRRAKWLVVDLSSDWSLIIHLKMTGQLIYQAKDTPTFLGGHTMGKAQEHFPNNHSRVVIAMRDGSHLFFQDMRKFGYVELLPTADVDPYFLAKRLGPEPMDQAFTLDYFRGVLKRRANTSIKAVLLDQSAVAGLGNIYVDDACWLAEVKPTRRVRTLTRAEVERLHAAAGAILLEAIALGGTSFSDYYQVDGSIGQYWSERKAYGRTGEPCRRCGTPIQKTKTAGRGTHFCPVCQR